MGQLKAAATVFAPQRPARVGAASSQLRSSAPTMQPSGNAGGHDSPAAAAGADAAPELEELPRSFAHTLRLSDVGDRSGRPTAGDPFVSPVRQQLSRTGAASREDARRSLAQVRKPATGRHLSAYHLCD